VRCAGRDCVLAKPRTYMNRSGRAAAALCRRYGASADDLLLVYDDADLALGRVRIRPGGSAGGHNGVQSILDALQSRTLARLRLGVRGEGRGDRALADYVLAPFETEELPVAERLIELGADAVESILTDGVTPAMNRFNGLTASPG
jgi:PTH1 family peptidyl-tRNA hydrolase